MRLHADDGVFRFVEKRMGYMGKQLVLSTLPKTWIFDLDGTLVMHNGYKTGEDCWLPGAKECLRNIPEGDFILILTGRGEEARTQTENFLRKHHIRYDVILFGLPLGERVLFNDDKPSGLHMSYAVNLPRDVGLDGVEIVSDASL